MNKEAIDYLKREIAEKEEFVQKLGQATRELNKLKEALAVLESRDVARNSKAEAKTNSRGYVSRKDLDKKILEEAKSLALKNQNHSLEVGEVRDNLLPLSEIHQGMTSIQLYSRIYFVLSKNKNEFEKTVDGWKLKNK
jgi:hypothetical protein